MLDNDIYVNHSSLGITTADEMLGHMERTLSFSGKDMRDAILVLCAYCFYLSHEELALLYPVYPAFSHLSTRIVKPLIEKKLLTAENAGSSKNCEGTASTFYCVTKEGYEQANSLCLGKITSKYKKNRSSIARSHTYYIGYNLIQILLLGYSVTWEREYFLNSAFSFKQKILQIDAKVDLYKAFGQKSFMRIYIEQDLGTEANDVLFGKLSNYAQLSLMDDPVHSLILFSFSPKGVALKANSSKALHHPYNPKKLNALLDYMSVMHLDDAYDAYITGYPDRDYVAQFLLTTGAGRQTKDGIIKRGGIKADISFIKEFRDLCSQRRNPYQQREFNLIRSGFAHSRLEEMVKVVYGYAGDKERSFIRMRKGYQVLYIPTTLVADRLKFSLLKHDDDSLLKIKTSLSYHFGEVEYLSPVSEKSLLLDRSLSINLRNEFQTAAGSKIYMEFPAFDLGAWLRGLCFSKLYHADEKHILVCVFETQQQLSDFYRTCNAYMDEYSIDKSCILCLMFYDIGKEHKLFYCRDEGLKRIYV